MGLLSFCWRGVTHLTPVSSPVGYVPLAAALTFAIGASLSAGSMAEVALGATHRIANQQTSATCFLVDAGAGVEAAGRRLALVTAAHFLEGTAEAECLLVLRTGDAAEAAARQEVRIPVRNGTAPLWTKHPEADIAVLAVELPAEAVVRPLGLASLADAQAVRDGKVQVGQEVLIPSFPARLEANEAGWPVLRRGMVASYPLGPIPAVKTLLVDVSTFGGDSGAPVVAAAGPEVLVLGVVLGMQRQTDRVTLPFEERTVHMPMGLAIVAHAALVRETLAAVAWAR